MKCTSVALLLYLPLCGCYGITAAIVGEMTHSGRHDSIQPQPVQQVAVVSPPPSSATATPPATATARAAQSAGAPASAALSSEWAERLTLLEGFRGQLTFARAMELLLDISSPREVALVLQFERQIRALGWASAHALGTDDNGYLIWGSSTRLGVVNVAAETARDYCIRKAGDSCKVVMVNGEFSEMEFLGLARQLSAQPLIAVREAYLQTLRRKAVEFAVPGTNGEPPAGASLASAARAYSSSRE